jgi:hypothetical protein
VLGQRDRGAETGDTAADHEEIAAHAHGAILPAKRLRPLFPRDARMTF